MLICIRESIYRRERRTTKLLLWLERGFNMGRKQKTKRRSLFLIIIILLSIVSGGLSVVGYRTYTADYHHDVSLAQVGIQHLQTAQTLANALPKDPFDAQTVSQAQHEFVAASNAFGQVNDDLRSLPGVSTYIPGYGPRLRAALDLLPVAIELSQAGVIGCNMLNLLIPRFHNPLNNGGQSFTMADFSLMEGDFHQFKGKLTLAI